MLLKTAKVKFSGGRNVIISEENWDVSMRLSEEQRMAKEKPIEDERLQYFREKIYPVLIACSTGDVPTLDEAYDMVSSDKTSKDIDTWYKAVQTVNPGWFSYLNHNAPETVIFGDKSKLVVSDGNVPSGIMRIRDLEDTATKQPLPELSKQVFRATFYPKLAACSTGDVPDEETARTMPTKETNRWYEAVCRVNPHWFAALLELKAEADAAEKAEELKKKRRKRAR